jgi:hypothetical protein
LWCKIIKILTVHFQSAVYGRLYRRFISFSLVFLFIEMFSYVDLCVFALESLWY